MRRTAFYLPTMKDTPAEAQIVSHRVMLRAGMVRQCSAGIYAWLPLGLRVLNKIARIVREEQDAAGCNEVLMPTIQSADLWRQSGRYDAYGPEMLRITDRHERDMLFGPTNEEMVTELFSRDVKSYKQLPLNLYHIQWKFRDEIRPRFGVMRGREFLMKDGYSFDISKEAAAEAYKRVFISYLKTFKRMGLVAFPMEADTGPIGGDLSHEFLIEAKTGESEIFYDAALNELDIFNTDTSDAASLDAAFQTLTAAYARTDETHEQEVFEAEVPAERRRSARGIEVGHIFYFGTKYSEPLGARVMGPEGNEVDVHMGSYGIGVSRLVGGIIEASHDEQGVVWPVEIAPFHVGLINLKVGHEGCDAGCQAIYDTLRAKGVDVLYDDRDERAGAKFADMELIGLPWVMTLGPRGVENGLVEVKNRKSGEKVEVALDKALDLVMSNAPSA
jgi:prolyl-tRNA synthetase